MVKFGPGYSDPVEDPMPWTAAAPSMQSIAWELDAERAAQVIQLFVGDDIAPATVLRLCNEAYATFAARLEAAVDWIEGAVGRRPHSSGSQGQEGAGAEVCVDWTQSRQGIASGQIILVEYGATQAVVHTGERTYITRHAIRGFVERLRAAGLVAAEPGVLIGPEEAEGRALAASGTSGFGAGGAGSRGSRRDKAASQVEGKTGGPEA